MEKRLRALNELRVNEPDARPLAEVIAETRARLDEIRERLDRLEPAPLPRAVVVRRSRW